MSSSQHDAQRAPARTWTGGRRTGKPGTLAQLGGIVKALVADPRYKQLSRTARYLLHEAISRYVDGQGRWFVKHSTLGSHADVSEKTVERAVAEWEAVGLVAVEAWKRPPGSAGGTQGANTYQLDPKLLTSPDTGVAPTSPDTGVATERVLNETNVKARQTPWVIDECFACGKRTPVRDDGKRLICFICENSPAEAFAAQVVTQSQEQAA